MHPAARLLFPLVLLGAAPLHAQEPKAPAPPPEVSVDVKSGRLEIQRVSGAGSLAAKVVHQVEFPGGRAEVLVDSKSGAMTVRALEGTVTWKTSVARVTLPQGATLELTPRTAKKKAQVRIEPAFGSIVVQALTDVRVEMHDGATLDLVKGSSATLRGRSAPRTRGGLDPSGLLDPDGLDEELTPRGGLGLPLSLDVTPRGGAALGLDDLSLLDDPGQGPLDNDLDLDLDLDGGDDLSGLAPRGGGSLDLDLEVTPIDPLPSEPDVPGEGEDLEDPLETNPSPEEPKGSGVTARGGGGGDAIFQRDAARIQKALQSNIAVAKRDALHWLGVQRTKITMWLESELKRQVGTIKRGYAAKMASVRRSLRRDTDKAASDYRSEVARVKRNLRASRRRASRRAARAATKLANRLLSTVYSRYKRRFRSANEGAKRNATYYTTRANAQIKSVQRALNLSANRKLRSAQRRANSSYRSAVKKAQRLARSAFGKAKLRAYARHEARQRKAKLRAKANLKGKK